MEKVMKLNLFVLLLAAILLAGCMMPRDKILGTWKTGSDEQTIYFTFYKNNELNINNEIYMQYAIVEKDKIRLGQEEPALFFIEGNTLTINQEGHILTLTKVN